MELTQSRKRLITAALVTGAILGSAGVASAVTGDSSSTTATTVEATTSTSTATVDNSATTTPTPPSAADGTAPAVPSGPHQANGITETPLTGDDLTKATAAAATAAPGGTVERAETDADGATYEVHITKADGTKATVKLKADFSVSGVEADGGRGGKGGKGGGPHGTETALTGDNLTKANAAAATAAPGSTVVRAETDADGDAYEVHITKADGSSATVKLNSDFSVRTVEAAPTK
jgi:uncharacterized membrane protein YkoI